MDGADFGRLGRDVLLFLPVASATLGLVAGFFFSWIAILVSGSVLAILAAAVLQHESFGLLAGIAIIVACLTLNQIAYLIGTTLVHRTAKKQYASPRCQPHDDLARVATSTLPKR
jgi:membrane protein DedA with SNARE-associated domain